MTSPTLKILRKMKKAELYATAQSLKLKVPSYSRIKKDRLMEMIHEEVVGSSGQDRPARKIPGTTAEVNILLSLIPATESIANPNRSTRVQRIYEQSQ